MASRSKTPRLKEAEYQKTIVATAQLAGWLVHAERPAQTAQGRWLTNQQGRPGFPDLVLVHPQRGQLVFLELKRKPNKPTDDQLLWQFGLQRASQIARIVYVPEQLTQVLDSLTTGVWEWPDELASP